jgi:hypothetical protein
MRKTQGVACLATVGLTVFGLIGGTTGVAAGAAHHSAAHKYANTPTLKVTVTTTTTGSGGSQKTSYTYKVNRKHLTSGLVHVAVKAKGGPADISLASLEKGYTLSDAFKDYETFQGSQDPSSGQYSKAGLKALNRFYNHVTFYGGPVAEEPGITQTDTLDFNKATEVYILNDSGDVPALIGKVRVVGKQAHRRPVQVDGTITARTNKADDSRFGGDIKLPRKGVIAFKVLKSSTTPHFLSLVHVKEGTTKKQIEQCFNDPSCSNGDGPPPFIASDGAEADTDIVNPGYRQDLHVNLPKGEYAELCFVADRKTGMPHALMGMIKTVHLV